LTSTSIPKGQCHLSVSLFVTSLGSDIVGGIPQGGKCVDLPAFVCLGEGPDVLGVYGVVESIVGPVTFSVDEGLLKGFDGLFVGCPYGG